MDSIREKWREKLEKKGMMQNSGRKFERARFTNCDR